MLPVLPFLLAAALPPSPPSCEVDTDAAIDAAIGMATLPLLPLTVLFDDPLMLGLQPAFTVAGIARPAMMIAIVMSESHLFML